MDLDKIAVVRTSAGLVRGRAVGGIYDFKGIPYGASTVGQNRFVGPKPAEPWDGVRDALSFGAMAVQSPETGETYTSVLRGLYPTQSSPMSEDCLSLNIWTPALGSGDRYPVMVWLHPGGFAMGAGNSPWTDGAALCRRHDVVIVSINHRLNLFGHLYLGDLVGKKYRESGNVGLLDITAALVWIRDNIARFGGDPNNVTLFGESGGAQKVSTLLAVPQARGLFHKAIVMSNAIIRAASPEDAQKNTLEVLRRLGLSHRNLEDLHQLPASTLLKAIKGIILEPVTAGECLPRHPFDPDAPAVSAEVPVLIGTTKDEARYYDLHDGKTRSDGDAPLGQALVDALWRWGVDAWEADALVSAYSNIHPKIPPTELFYRIATGVIRDDADILAERKAKQNVGSVYKYLFSCAPPGYQGKYGACHTFEVPFVFDNLKEAAQLFGHNISQQYQDLAWTLGKAWTTFASSSQPTIGSLPHWKRYTVSNKATMILDLQCKLTDDLTDREMDIHVPRRAARLSKTKIYRV